MTKVSLNFRLFLVAWLASFVTSVPRPSAVIPKDDLYVHHYHPTPSSPPSGVKWISDHFKFGPSMAFSSHSLSSPPITWLSFEARTAMCQHAYDLAGKAIDASHEAFGKLVTLLPPYQPGSLGHLMRMAVLWALTPSPTRTISPLSTPTKSNYPAIPTPGHFWSASFVAGNTTGLLAGFNRLVQRCPVDSHSRWTRPSIQEFLEVLLLIVSCVTTLPVVFVFIRTSWEDLDEDSVPGFSAGPRIRPAASVPRTFYGFDVADAFADTLDEPFNAGSFVDIWSSSDNVSVTQGESQLDTSVGLAFPVADTRCTTSVDGCITRVARWVDMVGMSVQITVKCLLPGRLDEPVLYISEGFISQKLEEAGPEWKENLLNEVLALEQSTLEWLGLDLTGTRAEVTIDALIECYGASIDYLGLEYEYDHGVESRRMTFAVEFGVCDYSSAPSTGSMVVHAGRAGEWTTGAGRQLAITYPQLPLERMVFIWLGIYAVRVSDNLFAELLLGTKQATPWTPTSTVPWYARLIEWIPLTSDPAEADPPPAVKETPITTWARPRLVARPSGGLYRPPRLQNSLTEERRAERARERQGALERLERETEKEIENMREAGEADGARSHKKTRRGRRAGKRAREWAARHEELAQAAREYVRGGNVEGME